MLSTPPYCHLAAKDLSQAAAERVAAADTRAGRLAAMLIQHSLLECERADAMATLMQHLLTACREPFWASAPLYALRLVLALSRVAGASRTVDLECSQREEATRLLAKAAEALTICRQKKPRKPVAAALAALKWVRTISSANRF